MLGSLILRWSVALALEGLGGIHWRLNDIYRYEGGWLDFAIPTGSAHKECEKRQHSMEDYVNHQLEICT